MAVRLTRDESKAKTRRDLLAAARRVFLRDGFHRASLEAIAAEAGYTKGAIYSNFAGKDELYLAVADQVFEERMQALRASLEGAATLEAGIRDNARVLAEAAAREPTWTPVFLEFWTHASRDPALLAEASALHERVLDSVAEVVGAFLDRFGVEPAVPVRELVRSAIMLGRGAALERLLDPAGFSVERFEDAFLALVSSQLRPDASKGG